MHYNWYWVWSKPALIRKYLLFGVAWPMLLIYSYRLQNLLILSAMVSSISHRILLFLYHYDKFEDPALRSVYDAGIIVACHFHRRHRLDARSVYHQCMRMQIDCLLCCCCYCCYCHCRFDFDGPRLRSMCCCPCYCCYCSLNYFVKLVIDVGRTVEDRVEDARLCAVATLPVDAIVRWLRHTFDGSAIQWHRLTLTQFDAIEHLKSNDKMHMIKNNLFT